MAITKVCPNCGKQFKRPHSKNSTFCERKCYREYVGKNRKRIPKEDLIELYEFLQMSTREIGNLCGYNNKTVQILLHEYNIPVRKGGAPLSKNGSWKGGKQHANGYIKIKAPQHPQADSHGYVPEHRLIWEAHNKRKIPDDWIIHHLNAIRNDNRIENLVAMPKQEHHCYFYIQKLQKRIRDLEEEINGPVCTE